MTTHQDNNVNKFSMQPKKLSGQWQHRAMARMGDMPCGRGKYALCCAIREGSGRDRSGSGDEGARPVKREVRKFNLWQQGDEGNVQRPARALRGVTFMWIDWCTMRHGDMHAIDGKVTCSATHLVCSNVTRLCVCSRDL